MCQKQGGMDLSPLPDYLGVSQRQTKSPGLPYGSPNVLDAREVLKVHFSHLPWVIFGILNGKF